MLKSAFCLLLLLAGGVHSYSEGAPEEACLNMVPQHGVEPQASQCPYIFTAEKEPDGNIRVTIKIPPYGEYEYFKGFLIQARLASNKSAIVPGIFNIPQDDSIQHLSCSRQSRKDTITHTSSSFKKTITTLWEPPPNFNNKVIFRATILRNSHVFWVGEDTDALLVTRETPLASPPANEKEIEQQSPQKAPQTYKGCSVTKACMAVPDNCIEEQNCDILLTYQYIPSGKIKFEITGSNVNPGTYVAMAISDDNRMGSDAVTECLIHPSSQTTEVRQSWNVGHSNTPLNGNQGLSEISELYADQQLTCSWQRDLRTKVENQNFDLGAEKYFILLARGPVLENGQLRRHVIRQPSLAPVNFTEITAIESARISPLIQLHGTLMVIAWLLLVNIGIVLARHYKPIWQEYDPCGVKVWFCLHRGAMILALGLIIIALTIIFVEKKGWSSTNPHTLVGIIAAVLACVQPIMALFRPDPTHSKRYIFNWSHLIVGNCAHLCAIGAIFLSANLPDTEYLYPILNYPLALYIAGFAFSHIVLHFVLWAIKKRVGHDVKIGEVTVGQQTVTEKSPPGESFKKVFIYFYFFGMIIVVSAIIIMIWL